MRQTYALEATEILKEYHDDIDHSDFSDSCNNKTTSEKSSSHCRKHDEISSNAMKTTNQKAKKTLRKLTALKIQKPQKQMMKHMTKMKLNPLEMQKDSAYHVIKNSNKKII